LLVAGLLWEKSTAGWWLISQANRLLAVICRGKSNKQIQNFIFLFGCVAWSLWLIRNAFIFQDVMVASPNAGLYHAISFIQRWKILNREKIQQWINSVILKFHLRLSSLRLEVG
jgi:hypothetical protein